MQTETNPGQIQALLLQPPPGDLTGPYPALCYLKSYAAQRGHRIKVIDLGIEAFHYLASEKRVVKLVKRVAVLQKGLESNNRLTPVQQEHYRLLLMAAGFGLKPDLARQAYRLFKDADTFYDYRRYKKARDLLNAFFRLLGAVTFPTTVTPSGYSTVTGMQNMAQIWTHCRMEVNPYIDFYESVLFPQVAREDPAVIGISMVFGTQSVQALVLARLLKNRFPHICVALGGAYLSQWVMVMGDEQLVSLFSAADAIICGEGEVPFTDLLGRVIGGQSIDGLPNVIHRDLPTGAVKRFKRMVYTDVTRQPPPDFSDLNLDAYLTPETVLPYSISRGCYWGRCVFCQNRYGDHRMRRYQTVPIAKAISEMDRLAAQYGTRHFNFSNDVIDPAYLTKFSRAVINGGHRFIWNTDLRAEKQFDGDMCRLMARAGLNSVAIGFESGCQKTLDAMDKGKQVATVRAVMKNLYDAGIAVQAMGIFGFPGETEADGQSTVVFLEQSADHISYYVMGLLMVMPGSRMYADPQDHGVDGISYTQNPLRTPEPVWRSSTRMSKTAVHRLYQRLDRLEQIYLLDEYPFVGGLSTNHGFLYFRRGPDILKRLQADARRRHHDNHHLLGLDDRHRPFKKPKPVTLRFDLPYCIRRLPFKMEPISPAGNAPSDCSRLKADQRATYLIDALNAPIPIGNPEIRILEKINGVRTPQAVLKTNSTRNAAPGRFFLMYLIHCGLVVTGQERLTDFRKT